MTDEPERDEDEILLLKPDQSVDVRTPRLVAEADGRLNAIVLPLPVIVKSVPVVEVAKSTEPDETCWPAGPTALIVPALAPIQAPLYATQPLSKLMPFEAEVVAVPSVSAPTIVVEALMVEEALETKPLLNVSVVVVALFVNGYAKFA